MLTNAVGLGIGFGNIVQGDAQLGFTGLSSGSNNGLTFTRNSRATGELYDGSLKTVGVDEPFYWGMNYTTGFGLYDGSTRVHPSETFNFNGKTYNRLAHYEPWPGATTAVSLDKKIAPGDGFYYECTTAGTTGGSEPTFTAGTTADGSVVWTRRGTYQDKIGLLVEPAATNKCECFAFPPADELQGELVTNGTFDTDTAWGKGAGVTISGGEAVYSSVSSGINALTQGIMITEGKIYRVKFDITEFTTGGVRMQFNASSPEGAIRSAVGSYTEDIIATDSVSSINLRPVGTTTLKIDNVSIEEVTHAVGTKSFHDGSSFIQNIDGFTVSGDTAGFLHIRAATAAEITKFAGAIDANGNAFADKMYEADNSGGAAQFLVNITGSTGGAGTYNASLYFSSDGNTTIQMNSTAGQLYPAQSMARQNKTMSPASSQIMLYKLEAAVTASFLGPNLVEASYVSSPILTAGASATRAAVDADPPSTIFAANNVSYMIDWIPETSGQTVDIFGTDTLKINADASNIYATVVIGTVSSTASIAVAHAADTKYRIGIRKNDTDGLDIFVDGTKGTGDATATGDVDAASSYFIDGGAAYDSNAFAFKADETDANMQTITGYDGEA